MRVCMYIYMTSQESVEKRAAVLEKARAVAREHAHITTQKALTLYRINSEENLLATEELRPVTTHLHPLRFLLTRRH